MSGSLQSPVLLLIFYEQWLFVVGIIVFPQKISWSLTSGICECGFI